MMVLSSTGSNNNPTKYTKVNKKQNGKQTVISSYSSSPLQHVEGETTTKSKKKSQKNHDITSSREYIDNNNNQQTLHFIDTQDINNNNNNQVDNISTSNGQQVLNLEEVYICNCCGVTKELNPSIKFMSTYRCIFFLFNFLVFIFGLANFGMGLWFRIDPKVYEIHKYIETQNFTNAGWLLLFCGFLACLISLIGFIGAAKQAISLLILYFTITIILTISFVGTLTLLTVYGLGSSLEQFMIKEVYEQMRRRSMLTEMNSFQTTDAAQFMDFIQVKMRCCGATDFRDYLKLGMTVPTTCYTIDKNYINAPGCGHAIRLLLDIRAGLATGLTLGSLIAQLLTIVSSALMFCSIYHYRANPRTTHIAMTARPDDALSSDTHESPVNYQGQQLTTFSRNPSPVFERVHSNSLNLQRPRSRTPIII